MATQIISPQTGYLKKTGQPYILCVLDTSFVPQMTALHAVVSAALPELQKSFIVPRNRAVFEGIFDSGHQAIGIISGGELLAQSIILTPGLSMRTIDVPLPVALEKSSVLQGVLCHPSYRGNGLMQKMIRYAADLSQVLERQHIFAKLSVDNERSLSVFLRQGMEVIGHGYRSNGRGFYHVHAKTEALTMGCIIENVMPAPKRAPKAAATAHL